MIRHELMEGFRYNDCRISSLSYCRRISFTGAISQSGGIMNFLGEEKLESCDGTPYEGFTPAQWAVNYIERYGQIDGDHHKLWVMDQVVRILKGTPVELKIARWDGGYHEYRPITGKPSVEYLQWVEVMGVNITRKTMSMNTVMTKGFGTVVSKTG